jgi:hypothetical protein
MAQVLANFKTNPHNPAPFYRWGRTVDVDNNGSYTNYVQLSCHLQNREGIINVLINNGENRPQQNQTNPETYKVISDFKYNLFDSHYSNIILFNP